MGAAAKRRSSSARNAQGPTWKATIVRAAIWVAAVPALCVAVIAGGAAPLYLLLPDAKPAASETAPAPKAVASAQPAKAQAKPAPAAPEPTAEPPAETAAVSDAPPAETTEAAAAPEPAAPPPVAEPAEAVATVIPTPRPEPPRPAAPAQRDVAALEPPPAPAAKPPAGEPPAFADSGERAVILRTVTLRAGPHGRELGTVKQGTAVAVGRCDEWCEIRGPNGSGWVHSSFLVDKLPERRDRAVAARPAERREAARDRDPDWLDEGTVYDRDDHPVVIRPPQWTRGEDRPRAARRYAPPPRYDDGYYDPYY